MRIRAMYRPGWRVLGITFYAPGVISAGWALNLFFPHTVVTVRGNR